jgi:hypothetical protein
MAFVELKWDPSDPFDPGPCIRVVVMNTDDAIREGRAIGLEFPPPLAQTALLDTGSPFTFVSKTFAKNWRLFQTSAGTVIRTIGGKHRCDEYSGAISFPDTNLPRIESVRILSAEFNREPYYSCLIGRDIIMKWNIRFDGRAKLVTIKA